MGGKQPIPEAVNQPRRPPTWQAGNQSVAHATNRNKQTNPSTQQPNSQTINHSEEPSIDRPFVRSTNQSIAQSAANQPTNQLIAESIVGDSSEIFLSAHHPMPKTRPCQTTPDQTRQLIPHSMFSCRIPASRGAEMC